MCSVADRCDESVQVEEGEEDQEEDDCSANHSNKEQFDNSYNNIDRLKRKSQELNPLKPASGTNEDAFASAM